MKAYHLLVAGLLLAANGAVLLMYRGVVRGSYLFITAGTVLLPMAVVDFLLGLVFLAAFVREITRVRKSD